MKTVIEMAREAGLVGGPVYARGLERFAELVRAAAIKEAPDYLMGYADGVHAEREACAKVCEPQEEHDDPLTAWKIAAAIRARSKNEDRN